MRQAVCLAAARAADKSDIISRIHMLIDAGEITVILRQLATGDRSVEQQLLSRAYFELHRMAISRMRREQPGHTLQATALVHEAYLRLCRSGQADWQDRIHFFRIAARVMRNILVDYARQHR